jgi:hypothetical protein
LFFENRFRSNRRFRIGAHCAKNGAGKTRMCDARFTQMSKELRNSKNPHTDVREQSKAIS